MCVSQLSNKINLQLYRQTDLYRQSQYQQNLTSDCQFQYCGSTLLSETSNQCNNKLWEKLYKSLSCTATGTPTLDQSLLFLQWHKSVSRWAVRSCGMEAGRAGWSMCDCVVARTPCQLSQCRTAVDRCFLQTHVYTSYDTHRLTATVEL